MADGEGAAAAAGAGDADAAAAAAASSAAGKALTDGSGAAPEWLGTLPDELKADATLTRYKTVEDLARGHLEAHKVAKSKLSIPGEGAKDEDWGKVWGALGLPEKADGYGDFGLPALADDAGDEVKAARGAMVKGYQDQLHQIGVPAQLAAKLVQADVERLAAAEKAWYDKGEAEITALKGELGDKYEPQKEAAKAVFLKLFGAEAGKLADALDTKVGSALLMRGMMKLAQVAGEHIKIDGGGGDFNAGAGDPSAVLDAKMADKGWREKYLSGDTETVAEYDRLLKAAQTRAVTPG